MNLTDRPLPLTMGLYFAALGLAAAATYAGAAVLAPAVQAHFLQTHDRPQSRLDVLTANAREIREALARPVAVVEPLPPITVRPQPAMAAKVANKAPGMKLSAEARDAFARSEPPSGGAVAVASDRHRPE